MRINRVKLIAEMARQDMTTFQLSELSGVSRVTISSVRAGKSCSQQTAAKLAKGLGVDVIELIEQED